MLKNQVEITWCNSRSWWATDAGGLTGSRSPRPCPSPYWTGGGRPHSYQCRSAVKGINHCSRDKGWECSIATPVNKGLMLHSRQYIALSKNRHWIPKQSQHFHLHRAFPRQASLCKSTHEIRFLLSTLSPGSWNSVNSQHEDGYQQWKERSPWFCCHSEHLIMWGGN